MQSVAGAGDQVAFPVARHGAILDVRGTLANGHRLRDLSPAVGRFGATMTLPALGGKWVSRSRFSTPRAWTNSVR